MGKAKGFRLRQKLVKVFKWCRTRRRATTYSRLQQPGPISKIHRWVHSLKRGARTLCSAGKTYSGYIPVGHEPFEQPKLPAGVPKGHLAVYVGDKQDDTSRVLVPVIYFNHPLFGELLREAEKVYGFDHPGGIQIPCPRSELESIQTKIAAACGGGKWRR
ncbi:hypothetical protein BUALT_Bualt05G0072900 [Buddleja alternifolia]|uniref:Small auxin up regulated protein n=1 Tax=Buddleja alternifolia TaxID=168488 RepID=A0AAV6XTP9_9LAMI|nr:hypothetical protein BUALT_Bualt05G0072900 [Buddleja alternifolia]